MKQLLIDLLKIPSVSTNIEALYKIIDYVEDYFSGVNAIIEKYEFNHKPSIVIKNFSGKQADIVLNGHLDVVPASEENQFQPVEKDGKLFARGAGDMKSGVAIIMKLMKDLLNENYQDKKISLIITTDEEVGGFDGVAKLVDLGYTGKIVLIPDAGSLNKIVYIEKGVIHLELEFYGLSSHGSRPWLGENAIDNLFKFHQALKAYIQNDKKLYYNSDHWASSVSLNFVEGGSATNVIPDKVKAKFDIRFTEEFSKTEILSFINTLLSRTNGKLINKLVGDLLYTYPSTNIYKITYLLQKNTFLQLY